MTCGRGEHHTKLVAIIDLTGIDRVCEALDLDLERARGMDEGTADIDAAGAAWIDAEVLRLEAAGLLVHVAEMPEPEGIGPDDAPAPAEAPEPIGPEAGPQDPREALMPVFTGVIELLRSFMDEEMETELGLPHVGKTTPRYKRAVAIVLRSRIMLQLKLRKPLAPGETDEARVDSIDRLKKRLRYHEKLVQTPGFWSRHRFDGPFVRSGDALYEELVADCCAIRGIPADVPIEIGVRGIGKFLYPQAYQDRTPELQRLDEKQRRLARALIQATLIVEEATFASPLRREQELSSMYSVLHLGLLLIMEVGVVPPFYEGRRPPFFNPASAEGMELRRNMIERLLQRLDWLDKEQRKCRPYAGPKTAAAFFERLIDDTDLGDRRFLVPAMKLNIRALCDRFLAGRWEPLLGPIIDLYAGRQ